MNDVFLLSMMAVVMAATLGGLARMAAGPSAVDRMMSAQMIGTGGVGVLVLMMDLFDEPILADVALVLALLAAVTSIAFVRSREPVHVGEEPPDALG